MRQTVLYLLAFFFLLPLRAENESQKTYLEDIFIWKMTDELKLSVPEEKKFSSIQKNLNKQKLELNKALQDSVALLMQNQKQTVVKLNQQLNQHASYLEKYSRLASEELKEMRQLLGPRRLIEYLRIKSEINNKMKSLLAGESEFKNSSESKASEKTSSLPPPKIIIEK